MKRFSQTKFFDWCVEYQHNWMVHNFLGVYTSIDGFIRINYNKLIIKIFGTVCSHHLTIKTCSGDDLDNLKSLSELKKIGRTYCQVCDKELTNA